MVFHDPLNFNFLLGRDYVYAMKALVSTLFRVMCFPHNGNIVTINHLSFIGLDMTINHPTSLNSPYMSVTSTPLQGNYVVTYPVHSILNEKEYFPSFDLDSIVDVIISSIGLLKLDLPAPIAALDMYSFKSVVFPSI